MHVGHRRVVPHHGGHVAGQLTDLGNVLAGDAELNRVAHRRAVLQPRHPAAQGGELFAHGVDQPGADFLALFDAVGEHHELGEAGRRQLLVQRQIETRRAGAHIGHVVVDVRVVVEQFLQPFRLRLGGLQGGALVQLQIHHQLQPRRGREELLRHQPEQRQRAHEDQQGQGDHRLAVAHAPQHQPPEPLVEGFLIGVVHLAVGVAAGQLRQQLVAQVGHEHHGGDPGHQQRQRHHLENRTGVFAGAGLGGGDGQKAGGGDQRAGEHREGGAGPGEAGRLQAAEALLHFDRHHLHGDDGVVHHQAQRQHQRAQGDLVQADVEVVHQREGHCQHQRNRQRHHQAGARAQREEAHQQHDHQRFDQHLHEFADAGLHRRRLVGHLAQRQARRQRVLQALELGVQVFTQGENVAAVLHRHRQADGVFAQKAHARFGRVAEAAEHLGDVAQAQGAAVHVDGETADLLHRPELAGHPQADPVAGGLEEARLGHRVLRLQCLLHRAHGNAQGRQLGVGQLHPDFLVLDAHQLHLAGVLHALKGELQALGVVLHQRVVETGPGERVDVAEGGAELVIEERPLGVRGQGVLDVANLLAHLVPEIRDFRGVHVVAGHEQHLRLAGPGERGDAVVVAGLHQLLLDALGDLAAHLLGAGAGPDGVHHHHLEGKGRVFALAQLRIGEGAQGAQQDHRIEHQSTVSQGPFGKVEAHRYSPPSWPSPRLT